ncbi:MAG TPA: SDR family NAD(P)-dependent oxidoreductase, partial [Agromyces mariniharenae]|nr:SDR family NAD(P)-dependent oxidoreductase [Agromyces mariniharenae]
DGATDRLVAFVHERGLTVDSLVNNAGFGMHGAFEQADAARIDEQVRLNVGALVSLTRAFLPEMTASGRGILVNVASTAAFQPVPSMAVYGATKAFVLSFTEAVAWETRETGLRVTALCPGATRTEFFDVVGTDEARVGDYQTPAEVVATAMRALDSRRTPPSVVSGRGNSVSAVFARIMPRSIVLPITARVMAN